ncbi:minor capsid protein [Streptomyces erythrochromogenes]|uniref:minor capsid protein n=1 Tax=Streptomyces erythrochromogenes TaxID=285574 RepID=UPI002253F859|nr:minor capsid protein [Streptomyces erythrochromogenes]MCX5587543.1 minor capsid protein [Streptomyces erythrochromogenes]
MSQYVRLNWEGGRLGTTTRGRRAAEEGLQKALEHLLAESRKIVPLREGTLERSGRVVRAGMNGFVTYDTVYARRQHEELTWKHLPGRKAKYLEGPFNSEREVMLRLMAVPLRRWLRG